MKVISASSSEICRFIEQDCRAVLPKLPDFDGT
jgi:hypothetical protein